MNLRNVLIKTLTLVLLAYGVPVTSQETDQVELQLSLDGFAETLWGTRYADVKEKFRVLGKNKEVKDPVEIIYDSPGKEILIRRAGIYYRYLFYRKKNPEKEPETNIIERKEREKQEQEMNDDARFFFVESNFPMVPTAMLLSKLSQRYGKYTSSSADKTQGFYLWDVPNGYLVQWVEAYEDKPYSRNIYYISKQIREEIMVNLKDYQRYKELKALDNIIP